MFKNKWLMLAAMAVGLMALAIAGWTARYVGWGQASSALFVAGVVYGAFCGIIATIIVIPKIYHLVMNHKATLPWKTWKEFADFCNKSKQYVGAIVVYVLGIITLRLSFPGAISVTGYFWASLTIVTLILLGAGTMPDLAKKLFWVALVFGAMLVWHDLFRPDGKFGAVTFGQLFSPVNCLIGGTVLMVAGWAFGKVDAKKHYGVWFASRACLVAGLLALGLPLWPIVWSRLAGWHQHAANEVRLMELQQASNANHEVGAGLKVKEVWAQPNGEHAWESIPGQETTIQPLGEVFVQPLNQTGYLDGPGRVVKGPTFATSNDAWCQFTSRTGQPVLVKLYYHETWTDRWNETVAPLCKPKK